MHGRPLPGLSTPCRVRDGVARVHHAMPVLPNDQVREYVWWSLLMLRRACKRLGLTGLARNMARPHPLKLPHGAPGSLEVE